MAEISKARRDSRQILLVNIHERDLRRGFSIAAAKRHVAPAKSRPYSVPLTMVRILRWLVIFYKWTLSPLLSWLGGPASGCRFHPTCSIYFYQAVKKHGFLRGSWLGVKRLARCHPWGGQGEDPVPEKNVTGVDAPIIAAPNLAPHSAGK
jgi:putative membrane protein insertion efficiency factor